jgi:hypothetical protein
LLWGPHNFKADPALMTRSGICNLYGLTHFPNAFYESGIINDLSMFVNSFDEDVGSARKQDRKYNANWTIKINTDANIFNIA